MYTLPLSASLPPALTGWTVLVLSLLVVLGWLLALYR
jgi:hypothetical protein